MGIEFNPTSIQKMSLQNPGVSSSDIVISSKLNTSLSLSEDALKRNNLKLTSTNNENVDTNASRFFSADIPNFYSGDNNDGIASFRIITNDLNKTQVFPAGDSKYTSFIVTDYNDSKSERFQIVENSDSFTLNFFKGQRPVILPIRGILKNSQDNPWNLQMVSLWDKLMRGSQLAKNGYIMELFLGEEFYLGYPLTFQRGRASGFDVIVNFSMQFIVKESRPYKNIENTFIPSINNPIPVTQPTITLPASISSTYNSSRV